MALGTPVLQQRAWGLSCGSPWSRFRTCPCFFVWARGTSPEHVRVQVRLRAGSAVFSPPAPLLLVPLLPIHPFTHSGHGH